MTTYSISLSANKQTNITVEEYGSGRPFLLMHGGAGPQSMLGFAQRLAASEHAHVYVPTHPGSAAQPARLVEQHRYTR